MIPLPVREYENHYWEETRPHWIASGLMGVKGGKRRAETVIVSSWRQAGSPIKNGTRMSSLQVWMWRSQEAPASPSCSGRFCWRRNPEQQPSAALETSRLFSENRTFGIFKGSIPPAPYMVCLLLKGERLQRCSELNEGFRDIYQQAVPDSMFMGPNPFISGSQSTLPGIKRDYFSCTERK